MWLGAAQDLAQEGRLSLLRRRLRVLQARQQPRRVELKVQFKNDAGVPEVFLSNGPHGGNSGRNDGG